MSQTWLTTLKVKDTNATTWVQRAVGPMRADQVFAPNSKGELEATVDNAVAEHLLSRFPAVYEMVAPWAPLELVVSLQEKVEALAEHIGVSFEDK